MKVLYLIERTLSKLKIGPINDYWFSFPQAAYKDYSDWLADGANSSPHSNRWYIARVWNLDKM